LFSDITATSIVAIALTALLLSSSPLPSSFSFNTNTNRNYLAFASPSTSGSQTTVDVPTPPSSPSSQYPTLDTQSTQSSQSQSGDGYGPSSDNFNLPTGYIIEPFLENLSMPTSIALDPGNGTIYVAESITEYEGENSSILTSSSPHPGSFLSQWPQVRIVKAEIVGDDEMIVNQTLDHSRGGISDNDNANSSTIVNAGLSWPVIDMEVDDTTSLLYALHDGTKTISTINTTSGERADILATPEPEQPAAAPAFSDKYQEEEQQNPLSFLINSSSQIVLSGNEDYYDSRSDRGEADSNPNSYNFTSMLYMPCMNGDADNNYGVYCILGLPIDRSGKSAIVDNIGSINSSSSFILGNITSRPVGIAILNSSSHAAISSLSSSSPSRVSEHSPYALIGSQTSNALFNNVENDLLIITSQPPSNSSIFTSTNNVSNNEQNRSSNYNPRQQAQPPSMEAIADYPFGQLGQVAVVSVPSTTDTITSSANETAQTNQTSSIDEDNPSTYSPGPFGLNETTAFIANFGNSSAYGSALNLPKIIMLDVQTGNVTPFLALKHSDPNFTPIDIAFDYNNNALYVLSTGNNQEEDANNNVTTTTTTTDDTNNLLNTDSLNNNNSNGIIWKISYQGEEQQATTSSNSSSSDDNSDLDDESSSYYEDEDDTDDDSFDTDNSNSSTSNSEEDTEDNSDSSSDDLLTTPPPPPDSSLPDDDDDYSSTPDDSTPPASTTGPPPPPPSTIPDNEAPVANDQTIEIKEDTSAVEIELLATDSNEEDVQTLKFTVVSDPKHGELGGLREVREATTSGHVRDNDTQADEATITYTPDENYNGQDTFQFKASDADKADSNIATVTINIAPVNDAPIAEDDDATTDQDKPVIIDVLANDMDIDEENNGDDSFTIDSVDEQSAQGGSVASVNTGSDNDDDNNDDSGSGTHSEKVEYTPVKGFSGTDKFTYTIIDSNGATESAIVTITVNQIVSAETDELPNGASEDGEGRADNDND
jgi:Bacterial Ig domain